MILESTILVLECQGKIRRCVQFEITCGRGVPCGRPRAGRHKTCPYVWSVKKRAKGDPLPDFPAIFYNDEIGKEAPEARAGSLAPFFRARSRSGPKILTDNSVCKPELRKQFLPKQSLGRRSEKISCGIYPENPNF